MVHYISARSTNTRLNTLLWARSVAVGQRRGYAKHRRDDRCGFKDVGGICGQTLVSRNCSCQTGAEMRAELMR